VPLTLGAQNARVTTARDLLSKRGREQHRAFAIEGSTLLDEAVRSGATVREIFVTPGAVTETIAGLERSGVPVYEIAPRTFAKISDVETPTGVLAVVDLVPSPLEAMLAEPGLVLLVADLADPGNLGTLLRAAEAFGASGAIAGDAGVDPYHPKVVRAGMGAQFRLPLASASPESIAAHAPAAGAAFVGLAAGGTPLAALTWPERTILVVGHERHGLGRWAALCGSTAGIPMAPAAESLNAGVAGAIALYEAFGKRPADGP
jgi:TrmH family RNA methyltransferase